MVGSGTFRENPTFRAARAGPAAGLQAAFLRRRGCPDPSSLRVTSRPAGGSSSLRPRRARLPDPPRASQGAQTPESCRLVRRPHCSGGDPASHPHGLSLLSLCPFVPSHALKSPSGVCLLGHRLSPCNQARCTTSHTCFPAPEVTERGTLRTEAVHLEAPVSALLSWCSRAAPVALHPRHPVVTGVSLRARPGVDTRRLRSFRPVLCPLTVRAGPALTRARSLGPPSQPASPEGTDGPSIVRC